MENSSTVDIPPENCSLLDSFNAIEKDSPLMATVKLEEALETLYRAGYTNWEVNFYLKMAKEDARKAAKRGAK